MKYQFFSSFCILLLWYPWNTLYFHYKNSRFAKMFFSPQLLSGKFLLRFNIRVTRVRHGWSKSGVYLEKRLPWRGVFMSDMLGVEHSAPSRLCMAVSLSAAVLMAFPWATCAGGGGGKLYPADISCWPPSDSNLPLNRSVTVAMQTGDRWLDTWITPSLQKRQDFFVLTQTRQERLQKLQWLAS